VPHGTGGLTQAEDVLFGLDGNLYVSDYYNNAILRYNATTGAFMDVFASGGGLANPTYMLLVPEPAGVSLVLVAGLLLGRRR
jgi:hypothetical protein